MALFPTAKPKAHSLTGRITLPLVEQAFKAVKRNRGAAGIDKVSIQMFEANLNQNLQAVMRRLKDHSFRPQPLRRKYIPKEPGKFRPLGIPTVSSYCTYTMGVWVCDGLMRLELVTQARTSVSFCSSKVIQ